MDRVDKLKADLPDSVSLPEASLRFILAHPAVSTIIVGMRNLDHVRQNIALSDDGMLKADLISTLKQHRWDRAPQRWSD